jgi:hypothetical protein
MIVARALVVQVEGRSVYFDYGACAYPEGVIGDSMLYLNASDVTEVVHEGFKDMEDAEYLRLVDQVRASSDVPRGDTAQVRAAVRQASARVVEHG